MTFAAPLGAHDDAVTVETVPLCAIPEAWDDAWIALAKQPSEPNPFAETWFMRPAIKNLAAARDDRMLAVWAHGALIGMLPVTTASRYGRLPVRHIENWVHYHCFLGTPLVRSGSERHFWEAVLTALDEAPWASNFLHIVGLDAKGPLLASLGRVRRADIVHRSTRAMLQSDLGPEAYYEANVRAKKRKEIRRLRARLDQLGAVTFEQLRFDGPVDAWIADFLVLESSGWKGREGTALDDAPSTRAFFRDAVAGSHNAGKLDMLRLTLDGKPIAMLVNFLTPPGAFAFKIAFDEDYARFSPGVLIKIENLKMLERSDIAWTDSCAVEDHPMINSLWAERRTIVRVTVPLAGMQRMAMFHGSRAVETVAARLRERR